MSLVKVSGNASGTGALTIAAPNTNSDYTLTLPTGTGTFNISGVVNEVPAGTVSAPSIYPTGDTNTGIFFPAADTIAFTEGGTEAMRIDSSGNLLVGGTTNTATANVSVNGNNGISIERAGNGYRQMYMVSSVMYFYNGTNQASLSSAGAWTNASDAKLKNSIVDIKYGLSTVMNTQPRSYKMNDLEGDYIGFVAQELQTVIPEVVSGDPEKQLGVDYGSLVAVAFKAIQEQQAIITSLTDRITALENK